MTNALAKTNGNGAPDSVETATMIGLMKQLYREAQAGLRRVVSFGIYCFHVKGRLPHGQFERWIEVNCPEVSFRTSQAYMQITAGTMEHCGLTMQEFLQKRSALRFSHPGEFLMLGDAEIPDEIRPLRNKIFELIDGKSGRQLLLEFKSLDSKMPGGDAVWEKWLRNEHPELLKGDKVPPRNHVPKTIRKEFDAWVESRREPVDPKKVLARKQKEAEEAWISICADVELHRDELEALSKARRAQVMNILLETTALLRKIK